MREGFDYRRYLLRVVRGHLRGTSTSHKYADRLLKKCPRIDRFAVDDLLWGYYIVLLDDSVYQESREFLIEVERQLTGVSQQSNRSYFRYDVRAIMPPDASKYYEELKEIHAFLENLSFGSRDQQREASAAYEQKLEEMKIIQAAYRATPRDTDLIYDLVIEEIATVLSAIDLGLSFVTGHLTPLAGYGSIQPDTPHNMREYPDITGCLAWARKALNALAGQDLLYFSWRFHNDILWLTLH